MNTFTYHIIKGLTVILFIIFFSSCSNTYRDFQKVKDMKWHKTDVKTFEVDIPEDGNYDLYFAMRHSTGYPFTSIKISITQITPEGEEFIKDAEFSVADEKGQYIGEVTGQLWDIEEMFSEKTPLEKGKYTFKISHNMNSDPVILIIDIGLIIKSNQESGK